MTDEIVKEEKNCECPFCKIVKCECFKKFMVVVVGSFIGCSLAILLFAPKPPKMPYPGFMPKCPMMERQLPPRHYIHKKFKGEFKGKHRPPMGEFRGEHRPPMGEFNHKMPPLRKDLENKRPVTDFPRTEIEE